MARRGKREEGRGREEKKGEKRGGQGKTGERKGEKGGGGRGGEEEWVVRKGIRYIHKRMFRQECPRLQCVEHWDHAQTESQTGQLCLWPATSTIMTHLYVRHQSAMTPAIIKFSAT